MHLLGLQRGKNTTQEGRKISGQVYLSGFLLGKWGLEQQSESPGKPVIVRREEALIHSV